MNLRRSLASFFVPAALAGVFWFSAGCSIVPEPTVDPTRYYVLTAPSAAISNAAAATAPAADALVLGLRNVTIAPYLNGKAMIVRNAANEIDYEDFARWAEPLQTGVNRFLALELTRSARVKRVFTQPYPFDAERTYDVSIEVLRCEGARKAGGATVASFEARIEITEAKPGGAIVARTFFTAPETAWDGRNFSALAQALSEGVAALGREVVAKLPAK